MKNYKFYVGIDISKISLDFCLVGLEANIVYQGKTENNFKGIKSILNVIKKYCISLCDVLEPV
nr:hypothetical protein [Elizabethkingia sp. ASV34]